MFENKPHTIKCDNRENVCVSGVSEVLSFDELSVVCQTPMGVLAIKGSGLKVSNLNTETGLLDVSGSVDSLTYTSGGGRSKQSVLSRIFK